MHFKGNLSEHPESRISLHENWNHYGEGIFTCMTSRTSDDFTYAPCFSDGEGATVFEGYYEFMKYAFN